MTVSVLVADDQAPFRRAVGAVLRSMPGFELVGEAETGEQAMATADALQPHLVLMDVAMEGIGGIRAARAISATHPEIVTVLLSARRADDLPHEARACAAAYVHKPDLTDEVLRALWHRFGQRPSAR